MTKKILVVLAFSFLFIACDEHANHEEQHEEKHEEEAKDDEKEEHKHEEGSEELQLNGGEKWAANSEMMIFVRKMEGSVSALESAEEKDFKALGADLQENVKALVSACTMTGASHDELHKWLMPYMALVKELNNAENNEQAEEVFHKIQHSFGEFNQYFE